MFSGQNIIDVLQKPHLPIDEFVIAGGGSLAAHGLRETSDIDVVCTPELFKSLEMNGWKDKNRPDGKPALQNGDIEVYLDVNVGDFQPTFQELRRRAVIIGGIPFISLDDAKSFKKAYGRAKDLIDIQLIDAYLLNT
jgi:hypothetical protein